MANTHVIFFSLLRLSCSDKYDKGFIIQLNVELDFQVVEMMKMNQYPLFSCYLVLIAVSLVFILLYYLSLKFIKQKSSQDWWGKFCSIYMPRKQHVKFLIIYLVKQLLVKAGLQQEPFICFQFLQCTDAYTVYSLVFIWFYSLNAD